MRIQEFLKKYEGLKWIDHSGVKGISCTKYRIGDYVITLSINHGKKKIKVDRAIFNEAKFEQIINMEHRLFDEIEPIIRLIIDFAKKEVNS